MIEVSTEWVLVIPMAASLALLLVAAILYSVGPLRKRGRIARALIYCCSACGRVYLDRRELPMVACPRCGSLNRAIRR